jgi:hypothetical protein
MLANQKAFQELRARCSSKWDIISFEAWAAIGQATINTEQFTLL